MKNRSVVFTAPRKAECLIEETPCLGAGRVRVRTCVSTVSAGTEKANLLGEANVSTDGKSGERPTYPCRLGYSSAGVVDAVGEGVSGLTVGDRVVVYWGHHSLYNTVSAKNAVKIPYEDVSFAEAALVYIATFPMAAIRKTRLEMGEPVLVMGAGLLGQLAVRLARAAGATPVVAVDPVAERREEALRGGADYAFDPHEADFAEKVKAVTRGGASVCVEVTGVGAGLDGALDCMRPFGRVALLGCTRSSDFTIDYYHKVHGPGITLIGAHTNARPKAESYGGWFTHEDDIRAVLDMIHYHRIDLASMIKETRLPEECAAVYDRLASDHGFPTVLQFDFTKEKDE